MDLKYCFILLFGIINEVLQVSGIAPKGHPREMKTKSVEKNLIRMLLNRYEQFGVIGRPVNDSKIKVDVRYGLQLFQILDLDENKQILRTNCWSIADERLREHRDARVVVSSNGEMLWVPQALFKSTCEVEITYFPFDTQICMLEFGSWTYDKTQMDISWWIPDSPPIEEMPYLDFSDYVPSNEWRTDGEKEREVHHVNRTIQIRSVKKHRRRSQTVGNEVITREYPVLRYLIRLRRNPSFYVFMLVIPCVLLSSLTLVVFWLPPESPAKMMLEGIGRLTLVRQRIPLPEMKKPIRPAIIKPHKKIQIPGMSPNKIPTNEETYCENERIRHFGGGAFQQCNMIGSNFLYGEEQLGGAASNWFAPNERRSVPRYPNQFDSYPMATPINNIPHIPGSAGKSSENEPDNAVNHDESPSVLSSTTTLERDVRELKKYVKMLVNRQKETARKSLVAMEWRTLAIVLDRLFFFIYITTIVIAVVVSVPRSTEPEVPPAFRDD
ncbi:nicotinic acetylcholine receptor, invertebrate [Schistosoma bovis]|uniref:Nicotinic acetylcholine receptor, invertebrate n=1 Tax=Schistosoma bovis TaxID=6184 RepID=A0A430QM20_SCHBO|nr:nicotinic acetylcholine receptor, invertebrate [Schistosoma bovis]